MGQTFYWTGQEDDLFQNPGNWSTHPEGLGENGVPGKEDRAVFRGNHERCIVRDGTVAALEFQEFGGSFELEDSTVFEIGDFLVSESYLTLVVEQGSCLRVSGNCSFNEDSNIATSQQVLDEFTFLLTGPAFQTLWGVSQILWNTDKVKGGLRFIGEMHALLADLRQPPAWTDPRRVSSLEILIEESTQLITAGHLTAKSIVNHGVLHLLEWLPDVNSWNVYSYTGSKTSVLEGRGILHVHDAQFQNDGEIDARMTVLLWPFPEHAVPSSVYKTVERVFGPNHSTMMVGLFNLDLAGCVLNWEEVWNEFDC